MTNLDTLRIAVERASAFQQYADENGFGRPQPATVTAVTTWFTAPGWTRAHQLEVAATQGCDTLWDTWCGRPYPYLEYPDTPTQAPETMPRCRNCLRSPDR